MTRSIAWDKVTHADVLRAIQEYDRQGLSGFSLRTDSLPPRLMIWSGTDAVTRRKQSWARLMSSPRANALPPVISRAGGKTGAVKVLAKLGFTIQPRQAT